MDKVITIGAWLIATFAPQYKVYWDGAMTVIKAAIALAAEFGWSPAAAFKRASEIQLNIRPADATEKAALHAAGLLEADDNHDFAYTMN